MFFSFTHLAMTTVKSAYASTIPRSFQPVNLPQWGWEPSWKADSGIADDAPNIIAARQNKWDLSGLEKPRMDDATYYEHGMGLDGIINTASDYVVSISSDSPETYIR